MSYPPQSGDPEGSSLSGWCRKPVLSQRCRQALCEGLGSPRDISSSSNVRRLLPSPGSGFGVVRPIYTQKIDSLLP